MRTSLGLDLSLGSLGAGFKLLSLSPVLWLPFDDGSGTTPQDASGHGNNGAFINTPTWDAGPPVSLDFQAADRDGVSVSGTLGSPAAVTLAAWIDLDALDGGSFAEVINIANSLIIRCTGDGVTGYYSTDGGSSFADAADFSGSLVGEGPIFLALVVDPANGRLELYRDGVSAVLNNAVSDPIVYGAGNVVVGSHPSIDIVDFDGRMRHVMVFPSALSTAQINAVMEVTASGGPF